MSLKSLVQVVILLVIIVIIGSVYSNYFLEAKIKVEEVEEKITKVEKITQNDSNYKNEEISKKKINTEKILKTTKIKKEDKKILEENIEASNKIKIEEPENDKILEENIKQVDANKNLAENNSKEIELKKNLQKQDVKNLVKDIEYLTTDANGNKYKILASSGGTNLKDNSVLNLENVRGIITSKDRSTIFIVSDFAEYNSSNQNSKFYQNVVINYENKQITCNNFDINMEKNLAIAYNNVVITDPNSVMKAGIITLDILTKNININPENKIEKVKIITN